MRGRTERGDEFHVTGVAERLAPYECSTRTVVTDEAAVDGELVRRAAALLAVMPRNQMRTTIERLLSPDDLNKGRQAIDALIEAAFVAEDETGHVRLRSSSAR
jgi:hypothetical protein